MWAFFVARSSHRPRWPVMKSRPSDSYQEPRWLVPMDGPLGSPFGPRWGRMHDGIDIEGWAETRVRATRVGIVTHVGYLADGAGYGFVIKVRHERRDRHDVRAPRARLRQARARS